MRDRMIRGGIVNSPRVNSLKEPEAELFFYKLLHFVDDFGRCRYEPLELAGTLFALRREVTEVDVIRFVDRCVEAGLVVRYSAGGRNFLEVKDFGQRLRSAHSKYPSPEGHGPCQECGCVMVARRCGHLSAEGREGREGSEGREGKGGFVNLLGEEEEKAAGEERLADALEIYGLYPRKVGKPSAVKAILKALGTEKKERLVNAVTEFAAAWRGHESRIQYCPHPATWFNEERYDDDPATWRVIEPQGIGGKKPDRNKGTCNEGRAHLYGEPK